MNTLGIYVHVPFCSSKCPYCDFYSVAPRHNVLSEYTDAVYKTFLSYSNKISDKIVDTIYFGGGTPSLLGESNLCKILSTLKQNFKLESPEVTVEVNPCAHNIDFEKLRSCGFNRLSIGLQSANSNELSLLGRKHSVLDVKKMVVLAQNAGFENISLDLMLCIQEQTPDSLLRSIDFCAERNIQHISSYMLKIEKNTPYHKNLSSLKIKTDDEQRELYLLACESLEKCGFSQYEISNFCKPSFESKHNLKYWNCDEYLGIGPSAHSFVAGKRFFYPRSLDKFLNLEPPIFDSKGGDEEEYLMLQLRLSSGINKHKFFEKFGYELPEKYFYNAKKYEKHGFTYVDDNTIRLSREGFLLSNELILRILFD